MLAGHGGEKNKEMSKSETSESSATYFEQEQLLESIASDLQWSALHVGAVAAIAKKLLQGSHVWTLRACRHFMRDDSDIMLLGLRYCANIGLSAPIETALSKFYLGLSTAKRLTYPLAIKSDPYTAAERQVLADATKKWGALSVDVKHAVIQLDDEVRSRLSDLYSENRSILENFLDQASTGSSVLVNDWGEISIPVLRQRRRVPRTAMNRSCELTFDGRIVLATLIDISAVGAGVRCEEKLTPKKKVSIKFDSDRSRIAEVVWSAGGRAGLKFIASVGVQRAEEMHE